MFSDNNFYHVDDGYLEEIKTEAVSHYNLFYIFILWKLEHLFIKITFEIVYFKKFCFCECKFFFFH